MIAEYSDPTHLDSGDNLVVSVVSFDPRGVVCSPRSYEHDPSILRACQTIVDEMKTSRGMELFAQESICDPHIETPLPYYYTAPTKGSTDPLYNPLDWPADQDSKAPKCVLRVQGRRPRQFGNWYKIWEAAAAITAMCVRKGKGGYWEGIGKPVFRTSGYRFLMVEFIRTYWKPCRGYRPVQAEPCRCGVISR